MAKVHYNNLQHGCVTNVTLESEAVWNVIRTSTVLVLAVTDSGKGRKTCEAKRTYEKLALETAPPRKLEAQNFVNVPNQGL